MDQRRNSARIVDRRAAAWQLKRNRKRKWNTGCCACLEAGGRQENDQRRNSARVADRRAARGIEAHARKRPGGARLEVLGCRAQ